MVGGRLEKQLVGEKIWSLQFAREFGVNFPQLFCTKTEVRTQKTFGTAKLSVIDHLLYFAW